MKTVWEIKIILTQSYLIKVNNLHWKTYQYNEGKLGSSFDIKHNEYKLVRQYLEVISVQKWIEIKLYYGVYKWQHPNNNNTIIYQNR